MALFVNPGKDWEKNMSEEDIAQMESQGYDVTELRAKRAKSTEEEEKERLREKEERENFKNPTNLNKLAPYLQTPRDMSTSFFKATAGSAPWLFKDRWKRKYTEAPIVYAAVVQANTALWMPGNNDYYPAVFVFALEQKHIHDTEWLKQIAEEINVLQNIKAEKFMLSHRTPFEKPKGIIMRWLGEIYDRRVKGEVYIEV